jgi:hypothetical protein
MRSTFSCLLIFLCFVFTGYAQDTDYRPNLIPPSLDAAALGKYAEYPIGLYTGTLPITIPLVSLTDGSLQVPIQLSYHASGNKVEEAASFAGLGFSLNAGGCIMRSVRNLPDDYPVKGFLDYSGTYSENYLNNDVNRFIQWEEIAKGCADAEPDAYFFNFNGYTGSFTFDWQGQLKINSATSWKTQVLKQNAGDPDKITGWKFISDDGTVYTFDVAEQATITNNGFPCQAGIAYNSAWYLSSITTPNGGRSIAFTYESYTQNYTMVGAVTHRIFCYPGTSTSCQFTPTEPTLNSVQMVYNCRRIKTITTSDNGSTVTFNYINTRTDEPGSGLKQLDEVVLKNKDATELRKFLFTYDYSTGRLTLKSIKKDLTDEPPYKFDYSTEVLPPRIGNSGTTPSFGQDHWGYCNGKTDNANLLPPVWKPDPTSATAPQIFYKGGNRDPDKAKMQAGILTTIIAPSGGVTTFIYGAHEYGSVGNVPVINSGEFTTTETMADKSSYIGASGPLEAINTVNAVVSGTGESMVPVNLLIKGFKPKVGDAYVEIYAGTTVYYHKQMKTQVNPEAEFEDFILLPKDVQYTIKAYAKGQYTDPFNSLTYDAHATINLSWLGRTITTTPIQKKTAGGLRILMVTTSSYPGDPRPVSKQFLYGDASGQTSYGILNELPFYGSANLKYYASGETPCSYDLRITQNKAVLGYGSHIGYSSVIELSGNYGSNGRTVYTFTSEKDYPAVSYTQPPFQQSSFNSYATGNSLGSAVFKLENQLINPVSDRTVTSTEIQSETSVNGLKFRFDGGTNTAAKFTKGAYEIKSGDWYPVRVIEKEYATDAINYVQREHTFSYANKRLKWERLNTSRNSSKNDETEYSYADDFVNPTPAIQSMVTKNMIGIPLEIIKKVSNNNFITAGVFNTYSLDASSRVFLSDVKKLQLANPLSTGSFQYASSNPAGVVDPNYATETTLEKYDTKENLVQLTGKNGITNSFLYDKHNAAPMVLANGVAWDKMAWSGFENTDPVAFGGAWTLPGTYSTTDFNTGKRSYNGIASINTAGFPATSYVLSFWMKGGTGVTVNGGSALPVATSWTLYETKITGGSNVSIDTKGGLIDEVRIYPADAQLTTASYDQLIGANTATDVKSKPGFYEYDNLWRLHLVKDHNKDIVKRTNYEFEILAPLAYTLTATQTGNYTYQFQVTGGSAGYIYEWDFDDLSAPSSGTATSVSHTFSSLTLTYTVKVKIKNSVNTLATLIKDVTVQKTGGSSVCSEIQNIVITRSTSNNKQATFTVPTISGAGYWWDFGDNTFATTASAIHLYPSVANTMSYNVNVTVSASGKSCSAKTSIKINP